MLRPLGEGAACDYHARPKVIESDKSVLIEAIRVVDPSQLDVLPDGWLVDAARCSDHAVDEIMEPTSASRKRSFVLPSSSRRCERLNVRER